MTASTLRTVASDTERCPPPNARPANEVNVYVHLMLAPLAEVLKRVAQ